jgi:hypothetical protein
MRVPIRYAPNAKNNSPNIQMLGYVNECGMCNKLTKKGAMKKEISVRGNKNL